tara:strand:- start:394 stop:1260 length:867 start_codon:yes stop_codon:yes gene_type:complete
MALESKIIYKIQKEIITNVDIKKEFKYLTALNNDLKKLNKEKIFKISKDSIIREKIKKIELTKNFKTLEIKQEYLNKIIKNVYKGLNLKSIEEFNRYLENYNLQLNDVKEKMIIEALWNQLIVDKYNSKIEIDVNKLRTRINSNKKTFTRSFLLSEIVFEIKNKEEIKSKYALIVENIDEIGFENTSSIYSIADTAKTGGKIGWINEQSLNSKIREAIISLKVNGISKPFLVPGGVLVLKINDIKNEAKKIDTELELKKAIYYEKNKQLSNYSKIYFNKIKKNLELDD